MGGGGSRADLVPGIVIAASVCFVCVYQGHSIYQEMTHVSEVGWKCRFQVCPHHCPPSPDVDTDSVFLALPWSLPPHLTVLLRPEKDESVSLQKLWFLGILGAQVTGKRWGHPYQKGCWGLGKGR